MAIDTGTWHSGCWEYEYVTTPPSTCWCSHSVEIYHRGDDTSPPSYLSGIYDEYRCVARLVVATMSMSMGGVGAVVGG